MQCPVCTKATLLMSERQGVEIDYCPQCRGVWLDRGELDKLIQLSAQQDARTPAQHTAPQGPGPARRRPDFDDSDFGKHHHGHARKKSWLSELFD